MIETKISIERKKKENKKKKEYAKIIALVILIHAFIWVDLSYILAFLDKIQIAEQLAIVAVTSIIGTFAVYSAKSFLEKNSRNKHKVDVNGLPINQYSYNQSVQGTDIEEELEYTNTEIGGHNNRGS